MHQVRFTYRNSDSNISLMLVCGTITLSCYFVCIVGLRSMMPFLYGIDMECKESEQMFGFCLVPTFFDAVVLCSEWSRLFHCQKTLDLRSECIGRVFTIWQFLPWLSATFILILTNVFWIEIDFSHHPLKYLPQSSNYRWFCFKLSA